MGDDTWFDLRVSVSLIDLDGDSGLAVIDGGESLGLLGGDGGVPLDQGSHDTTGSFVSQGAADQDDVVNLALVPLCISHGFLHRFQGSLEQI